MSTPWDDFLKKSVERVFANSKLVIDIGGGLRAVERRGNRYDPSRAWIKPLIDKVDYKILDPVPDYHPDIIGDIHALPLEDDSVDAYCCLAVLEHVKNPFTAVNQMQRTLKKGGLCLIYAPFIYRYHPLPGYFEDYWRYTEDGLKELFKGFSRIEIQNVRGRGETVFHLTPFTRIKTFMRLIVWMDKLFHFNVTKQTAGFYLLAEK